LKLKTIYIKDFGKLKNFKLSLMPGLNLIYGTNEAGKTTVMNFIKMMFYGSSSKSSDINKNPRKKYSPWDGCMMSGYIEFEFSGTNYRLEREFRNSNVTDIITLWNLDTGQEESLSCKYDVGEQFFGLGASAFEKSVFIGGMSAVINASDKEDEISKRLMNFATSCDDSVSYEIVRQRLKKAHDELHSKHGKSGELDKMRQLLSDKTELLSQAEITDQKKLDDESMQASFEKLLQRKTEYYNTLSDNIKEQRIIRELHSLETQNKKNAVKEDLQKKLDELTKKISNGRFTVTDDFLDKTESMLSRIAILKNNYSEKKEEFNTIAKERSQLQLSDKIQDNYVELDNLSDKKHELRDQISECEEMIEQLQTNEITIQEKITQTKIKEEMYNEHLAEMESHNNSILINYVLPVAAVFIALLALLVRNLWILIAILPAAIIIFSAAKLSQVVKKILIMKNPELEEKTPDYESVYQEYEKRSKENEISLNESKTNLISLKNELAETEQKKHDLEICNSKLNSQNEQKISEQNKINSILSSISSELTTLSIDLISHFSVFRQVANTDEIEDHIHEAQNVLNEIEKTQAILNSKYEDDIITDSPEDVRLRIRNLRIRLSELTGNSKPKLLSDEQLDKLEENLEDTKKEMSKLNDEITSLKTRLSTQYNDIQAPYEIKTEINEIKTNISEMSRYTDSLKVALSTLDEAGNEIRQTFGPKLNSKTQKIFSHLTGGRYSEILVSKNLEINAIENYNSQIRDWQYLSMGTAEQAYFSLRLAIADMITQNQIPLFLDDVFVQYDDGRADKGFEFISEYSRLNQVLFFTCHRYSKFSDKYICFP